MPLFIDRLSFHVWLDATRVPPLTYWTVVLPIMLTEPTWTAPPPVAQVQDWTLDTGNCGEAFAYLERHAMDLRRAMISHGGPVIPSAMPAGPF